jgi:hypothetical protein
MEELRFLGSCREKRGPILKFPLLPDDEREAREKIAYREGIVALDIVFDKRGQVYVVEIQGTNAGIKGISEDLEDNPRIPKDVREFVEQYEKKEYVPNPWFVRMTNFKNTYQELIPEEHRPESVVNGEFEHLLEKGRIIIKPLLGKRGAGIRIFDKQQLVEAKKYAQKLKERTSGYIVQLFIESRGAELAPEKLSEHPASLRVLFPFEIIRNESGEDEVRIKTSHVGYQRVAPEKMPSDGAEDKNQYRAGVVNRALNAESVPMSDAEYEAVLPVAKKIIKNLSTEEKISSLFHYQQVLAWRLRDTTYEVCRKLQNMYEGRVHFIKFDYFWISEEPLDINRNIFPKLDEMRAYNRFVRYVERELAMIPDQTWERLRQRHTTIRIEYKDGNSGLIVFTKKNKCLKEEFSATLDPNKLVSHIERVSQGDWSK